MTSKILTAFAITLALSATAQAQTAPGVAVGIEGAYYGYDEPASGAGAYGISNEQHGPSFGLTGSDVLSLEQGFVMLNGRASLAVTRYSSPGLPAIANILNPVGEFRAVYGYDLAAPSLGGVASPYAGLGYRVLYDDLDGGRLQQYLYLPLGVTFRFGRGPWRFAPNFEFDALLHGWNDTELSNVGYSNDLHLNQGDGYGLRGSFMAEIDTAWGPVSFGPFIRYRNVKTSSVGSASGSTCFGEPAGCVGKTARLNFVEPANETTEAGLAAQLRF